MYAFHCKTFCVESKPALFAADFAAKYRSVLTVDQNVGTSASYSCGGCSKTDTFWSRCDTASVSTAGHVWVDASLIDVRRPGTTRLSTAADKCQLEMRRLLIAGHIARREICKQVSELRLRLRMCS